ncbi:hypothetical protein [Thioalkalivibrio sp. ALJ1]|uniref:hypothetical protein n=1 Tax=Thioalkalivibrio sp. ALJ1 TaxID=1158144 RepID=UPI00056F6107|nr:hypothetical protein [Thioalkalivibrio sp. ALJ1]
MRRLELMGPPGVGKTTLLGPLQAEWKRRGVLSASPRWLPLWAAHERQATGALRRRIETALYARKGLQRWMRAKLEKEMVRHEFRSLREADAPWPEFLRLALTRGGEPSESEALTLERMQSFIGSVALARATDRLPGNAWIPFDEGLAQRAISLGLGAPREQVQAYLECMPAPQALVLLTAPPEAINERLRQRNPNVTRFHEMVEPAIEMTETAASICAGRGIPIVQLDAREPPEKSARDLVDNLMKLRQ